MGESRAIKAARKRLENASVAWAQALRDRVGGIPPEIQLERDLACRGMLDAMLAAGRSS